MLPDDLIHLCEKNYRKMRNFIENESKESDTKEREAKEKAAAAKEKVFL